MRPPAGPGGGAPADEGGEDFAFCNECGEKLTLPKVEEPIQLTREVQAEVEMQRRTAEQRTRFEQAVFRVRAYVADQKITPPECFISYAWGVPEHERWVEKRLATDLQKAGIDVVLDRWDNAQIGASVARFVERIEKSDRIVVVGTPLYRGKYENKDTSTGYVVAGYQPTKAGKANITLVTDLPVDIWNIHTYIGNEMHYQWGFEIPPGIPNAIGYTVGYGTEWMMAADVGTSGGTVHAEFTTNAIAWFAFQGNEVTLYLRTGPSSGIAEIFLEDSVYTSD